MKEQHGWFQPRPRPQRPDVACLQEFPSNVPARASQPRTTQAHPSSSFYARETESLETPQTEPVISPRKKHAERPQRRVCSVPTPPAPRKHTRRSVFSFGIGALATLGGLFVVPQVQRQVAIAQTYVDASVSQLDARKGQDTYHLLGMYRTGQVILFVFPDNYDPTKLKTHTIPLLVDEARTPIRKVLLRLETLNGISLVAIEVEGTSPIGFPLDSLLK